MSDNPSTAFYRRMAWMATVAVWITIGTVAASELMQGLGPGQADITDAGLLLLSAAAISLGGYFMPWKSIIARHGVSAVFYVWSLALILFGFLAVYAFSVIDSELYLLYFPAILFVVATLAGWAQVVMGGLAMLSYAAAVLLAGGLSGHDLFLRLVALALVGLLGSYITREQRETALENVRLYEEARLAGEEQRALFNRFGKTLASSLDVTKTLQLVADLAAEMTHTDATLIAMLNNQGLISELDATSGLKAAELRRMHQQFGERLVTSIVRGRATVQIADLRQELAGWSSTEDATLGSYLGVPLMLRGRVMGLLAVARVRSYDFQADEVELLSAFGNQAAAAIENARLFSALQERLRELSGLHNISLAFASLTKLEDTYGQLVERIGRLLDVERCVILLPDDEGRELVAQAPAYGLPVDQVRTVNIAIDERSAAARVWITGRPYLTNDAQSDPRNIHKYAQAFGDRSLLIVPMRVGGRTVGLLRASNKLHDRFTNNDVRLLTIFANQAAVVVRNAVLFREVADQRARLEAIFDNASDGIMIIDHKSSITAFNRGMESITGWTAAEAIGQSCDEVCPTVDPRAHGFCDLVCPKPYVYDPAQPGHYVETQITTRDGRTRDTGVSYSLLRSKDGETYGVAIVRDISQAKELDRVKSQFISTVSHELRTPLASIKASIGLLLANIPDTTPEPLVKLMNNIDRSGRRLESLVADLLDLARLESGRVRLSPRRIDLREVVTAAVATIRPLVEEKGQVLATELPEEPCFASGDRPRLEQVLLNLLSNANKYTPEGGSISVSISRMREAESNAVPEWLVAVEDTGPGIAPEDQEHVFERFYRAAEDDTPHNMGTGLGLAIAKALVELHGGQIHLESYPGRGSRVYISLPEERISEDSCC